MTGAEDKISVIVPVYNAEAYLPECIESIIGQTYPNLQIVLMDDGSTDRSGMLCDRYAAMDGRIEVYHTENKGLVAARKGGICHATGKYIGFVDADDYIEKEMYQFLLSDIKESGADFVHAGYVQDTEEKKEPFYDFCETILELPDAEKREEALVKYVLRAERERHITYSIWSKLFHRDLIGRCYLRLPDRQQYGEDVLCLCLCILESRRIRLSRRAFYHYRIREKSMSHIAGSAQTIRETELNYSVIQMLQNYNPETYKRLEEHIGFFIRNKSLHLLEASNRENIHIPRFYYRHISMLRKKKIVIYGAGSVGQDYYLQCRKYKDIEIVAWLDSNYQGQLSDYAVISEVSSLADCTFERILIAVQKESMAKEIENMLSGFGIPKEKILWEMPGSILEEPIGCL